MYNKRYSQNPPWIMLIKLHVLVNGNSIKVKMTTHHRYMNSRIVLVEWKTHTTKVWESQGNTLVEKRTTFEYMILHRLTFFYFLLFDVFTTVPLFGLFIKTHVFLASDIRTAFHTSANKVWTTGSHLAQTTMVLKP